MPLVRVFSENDKIFRFSDSWKISPNFTQRSLVRGLWPWLNKTSQSKKRRPLFSKNVLKVAPIHVYKFFFLNTSDTYRVFGNYFRPRKKTARRRSCGRLEETVVRSLWKKSRLFYTQNIFRKNNFRLIASRKEKKIQEILWKSRFRVETVTFLRFYRAAYLRRGPRTRFADQGPSKTVVFFRTPSKIFMSGTWNFRISEKNIKAIFREYFSSLREDSGKIFKLMTFTRGPRTTYCSTRSARKFWEGKNLTYK